MSDAAGGTRVIGLGNPIMGDDGLGLRALGRLAERYALPPEVELVDGGTWGMRLLEEIESAGAVLLLDAVDHAAPAGSVTVLTRHDLPRYFAHKLSPHQVDLREVLAACELRGTLPPVVTVIGAQPGPLEMSTALSPALEASLDQVTDLAAEELAALGHTVARREAACA
ncbi:MAG TPA: HyaD/HybD family hydrogenase maturation endopeptidase [Gemmatimonadales bacterium]|jgi:hydrogenase maturation protease|nr:HyaD/HybD family hydrogenase maturation endopeptidase [Gemmatimonadales bacterium]